MARIRIRTLVAAVVLFSALPPITGLIGVSEASNHIDCEAASYTTRSLSGTSVTLPNKPVFRFVNLSDSHILDDEASAAITGNWTESVLDPALDNGAAQRLQEEYTDEVLNAMIRTVNVCRNHIAAPKPELMIATGDLSDAATLNETRRYIDNLDGVSGAPTAYEANCGYTTRDSRGVPKLGSAPCTPAMQGLFAGPTGRLVADTQAPTPDPDDPTYQITPTRSARQIAETGVASTAGGSQLTAPGLPAALRCDTDDDGCDNERMAIPHYAVFGNHDGAVRGTVTFQEPFQAGFLAFGRYFLKSQREFINEFFYTESSPGPVGHGFNLVESARFADANDRNDGYYAFDAADGDVRMIVLNTIWDGVRDEAHRGGQTNTDTAGLIDGSEITDARGLEMGVMDDQQFAWLEDELDDAEAGGQAVLVFTHHPDASFTEYRFGQLGERSAVELDELLGDYDNVVAWIAGHTHLNRIRPCTSTSCAIQGDSATVTNGFWRIETASLIDYPQEGRIVELFDLGDLDSDGTTEYALRLTMIRPDPDDPTSNLSRELSEAEARCTTAALLDGPIVGGSMDPSRLAAIADNAEAAVMGEFCQGDESLVKAAGLATDRDTILLP